MGRPEEEHHILCADGRRLPVRLRRNPRARRITLRLDPRGEALNVVLPRGIARAEGIAFAERERDWVMKHLASLAPLRPFEPGALVPLQGESYVIRHLPRARRGVWVEAGAICVCGRPEHIARRVRDFLKTRAGELIQPAAREKAAQLDRAIGRITLRDTKTRWGSCSASGDLSFSWRLVMTPAHVLDYVVAHEVAHLVEANHGPRFWALTESLTERMGEAKDWLRRNGRDLWRYG
jgi:predicted metal-dependent hydrolase